MLESFESKNLENKPVPYVAEHSVRGVVKEFTSKEEYEKWWESGEGQKFVEKMGGSFIFREKSLKDDMKNKI